MDYLQEFSRIKLGHKRIDDRFMTTLQLLSGDPEASIHKACKKPSEAKGAYRLLGNPRLTEQAIIQAHHEVTLEAIRKSGANVVLIPQDTTEVNYTNLEKTADLGCIGTDPKLRGLLMHSALAVSPECRIFGLLHQKIWARPPEEYGKKQNRKALSIEEKESYKWLETMERAQEGDFGTAQVVHLCDREGDIYEFFQRVCSEGRYFLCRRIHNRKTRDGETIRVFLAGQHTEHIHTVEIPRDSHTHREKRTAHIAVRFGTVEVLRPQNIKVSDESLVLQVVSAQEINAPEGVKPVDWQVITNLPLSDFETAKTYLTWYSRRWLIETFHYTLKSGCAIEKLQPDTADRLKKLMEIYSIIAIRIMHATYLARTDPDASCEAVLTPVEWKVLYRTVNRSTKIPKKPPTIYEAVILIARLGGFYGYKSSGFPGVKSIWWGLTKLSTIVDALSFNSCVLG
jgi:hypothetical protein